ncbi:MULTISPECIES: cytochrome oxidase putative small subunit CydP [unclassified Paraburkholderia]|uniref:cytochrome oxidase putative small subunit CydP n=1 Tax=unclassified Paraburkholderia TaxID=2615204 RepID=UPI000D085DCD|nr:MULTISPECIES: cytochrome oxidase putative small subunit CydP [unclassified Paraburkholderia]PRY05548.1 hypothetical protein B0G73_109145 [Paraburkholderia sp. BL25I1N1]REE20451.1 hypothetical protein B0G71_3583 [Paraburkholderia sp. BL27I4N3]REG60913.1 hypothetical protein B0G80_3737 [Paraburkholderia sp. BL6669N2]RKR43293.1 hypothetical protein B0G82_0854 [Paraburkholderia sp. BL17N1]TDY25135.1 hypothetical protein B0G81_5587 [Paraburkholderia sp. BL6665CI2N2]
MTTALNRSTTRRRSLRQRFHGWVRGPTLARDIAIVLAIKFVLLMALKYTFFNHPQAEHMSLPPEQVAQALLSVPASHPSQGDPHAR